MQKTMSCWDGSSAMGSCPAMPTTKETCTAPANSGKVYWCENTSGGWSSGWCSMMPCNKEQCATAGKHWCENSTVGGTAGTAVSGWCSNMRCMPMPPAGKMTCPDGSTFTDRLTNCPKKGSEPVMKDCPADGTKVPVSSICPEQKTCSDGSAMPSTGVCPPAVTPIIFCPSGKQVKVEDECPATDFTTCNDERVLKGTICSRSTDEKTEKRKSKEYSDLTDKQAEKIKNKRDGYLKDIIGLETFFNLDSVKENDDAKAMIREISDLRQLLQRLAINVQASDALDLIAARISVVRDTKLTLQQGKEIEGDQELDQSKRSEELLRLQNKSKGFLLKVQSAEKRIATFEKKQIMVDPLMSTTKGTKQIKIAIVAPQELKDVLKEIKESLNAILQAETYNEAEDEIGKVKESVSTLEPYGTYIQAMPVLLRKDGLPRMYNLVLKLNRSIASMNVNFEKAGRTEKDELDDMVAGIHAQAQEVMNTVVGLHSGVALEENFLDFIEVNVFQKIKDINDDIEDVGRMLKIKDLPRELDKKINSYTLKLNVKSGKNFKVSGETRTQARDALYALAEKIGTSCTEEKKGKKIGMITCPTKPTKSKSLKELLASPMSQWEEKVLPEVQGIIDKADALDQLLDIEKKAEAIQGSDNFQKAVGKEAEFDVDTFDETVTRADARANFYRKSAFEEIARIMRGKAVSYGQFAQNQ